MHLEAPIDFDAIDGAPVDLLFVLLVPEAATDAHLELLRQIASMLDRKDVRDTSAQCDEQRSLVSGRRWTTKAGINHALDHRQWPLRLGQKHRTGCP